MKRILLMISFAVLFLGACQDRREKAIELLNLGISQVYAGEFDAAIISFNEALELQPDMAEAWFHLSNAHFNLGDPEQSMLDLDMAISLDSTLADAWFNRGNLWFYYGDTEKACEDWKVAESLGKPNVNDKTRWCP